MTSEENFSCIVSSLVMLSNRLFPSMAFLIAEMSLPVTASIILSAISDNSLDLPSLLSSASWVANDYIYLIIVSSLLSFLHA